MSDNQKNQPTQLNINDKWNQLKGWMKDLRFPMMIYYPSTRKKTHNEQCKIRGTRISWSSSDNACLNFFSGAEIRKKFWSHWEHSRQEEKEFNGLRWQEDERDFRLFLKNERKEKLLILYLMDVTEVTRIVFYFKYQLQLKKNIDFYQKHVDLPTVWKTARFFQPLLERMRRYAIKYQSVPKEQLSRELEAVKRLQQKKENPNLVESRLDVALIKETVADNYKQITFQILDFQIVGVVILDADLLRADEIGPLRMHGPGGMKEALRSKRSDEEERGQVERAGLDFKRQMTIKQEKRKRDKKDSQREAELSVESGESVDESPKNMSTQPNYPENIPSFKQNKPIQNNIFESNPNEQMFAEFLKNMEKSKQMKSPRPKSLNPPSTNSGTLVNASDRMRRKPRFTEATGGQIESKRTTKEDESGGRRPEEPTEGTTPAKEEERKRDIEREQPSKTELQNELEKRIKQPVKPPNYPSEDELSEELASLLEEKKQMDRDEEDKEKKTEKAEEGVETEAKGPRKATKKTKTKIFDEEDEDAKLEPNQLKYRNNVKSTIVNKSMRKSRR